MGLVSRCTIPVQKNRNKSASVAAMHIPGQPLFAHDENDDENDESIGQQVKEASNRGRAWR
jgi:hypothetical protein